MPDNDDDPAAFPIGASAAPVTGIHILFVDDSPSVRLTAMNCAGACRASPARPAWRSSPARIARM
jgi:hypothetical protein